MKMENLKSRISDFLNSEDGRVGVKAPLTLGVAAGGLLLAHAMTAPDADAGRVCDNDSQCPGNQTCQERRIVVGTREVWCPDRGHVIEDIVEIHTFCQ
ncbi:hypothetical protein C6496_14965 [Candidatus Poribacteria bacterium]|nr:MAG: hypothetical protein C6496_14965 [Candidatus Poribacteria bacterium]